MARSGVQRTSKRLRTTDTELRNPGSAVGAAPVPHDEARPYIVEMLDALRRQEEALLVNKPRYMLLARQYGFSDAEIAELLVMSEGGVRKAMRRAEGTPGVEFAASDSTVTAYVTRDSLRVFAGGTGK